MEIENLLQFVWIGAGGGIIFLAFFIFIVRAKLKKIYENRKPYVREIGKEPTISILIPAYNEEKNIANCVESCFNQTRIPDEVIVINDGSTDHTLDILKSSENGIKIIDIEKNTGNKSKAQEIALPHVNTDIFITTDADTVLDRNFVEEIKKSFDDRGISAVCGFVESKKNNWITSVREINYLITQTIYKEAQDIVGALVVIAGCSAGFRTKDFRENVTFDHDNLTEDLDFTYKLKLADKKIAYNRDAIVYTKDPNNILCYFKQLYRWYSGGWTCLKKNIRILKKPNNTLILAPLYLEAVLMGGFFVLAPLLIFISWRYFMYLLLLQFSVLIVCMTYGVTKYKRYELFLYAPHHYVLGLFEEGIFLYTFVKEFVLNKKNLFWNRAKRY